MAVVVAAGKLTGLDRPAQIPTPAAQLGDGLTQTYATIYATQPQLRTVVSFLARNIAQIGLHVYERVNDTDRRRLTDHPLARIIARPNPATTRYRWLDSLVHDLGIFDNAFLAKVRPPSAADGALQLLRLPPQWVTPLGNSWVSAEGYRVRAGRGTLDLPADQVMHFRGHNPGDSRWGLSPIESLRDLLAEELSARHHRQQLWRNGARHSGYITRPIDAPRWSEPARNRFGMEWRSQYTGDGPQAGGTPILEDGMAFVPAAVTPEQAQYIEARKLTREEVAAAFHVPLPMVGILDHATYSNVAEQHKQLYQDTLGPWLTMIAEEIELQLLPDLDTGGRVYVEFNLQEKLRGSFEEQAQQLQTAVGGPWLSRNEARARQNLPHIDGGDELIVPLNVVVGGQASPRDSAPPPKRAGVKFRAHQHTGTVTNVLAAYFARQEKVLAAALGAKKSAGVKAGLDGLWDEDRWDRELADDLERANGLVATAAGRSVTAGLGLDPDDYDDKRTTAWLRKNAEGVAAGINATTKAELAEALDEAEPDEDPVGVLRGLFAGAIAGRVSAIADAQVSAVSGFGTSEAVGQSGKEATKTWGTTSAQPRPSHAAMNGESVPMYDLFSNGARWPGDSLLTDDDRAGCTCEMTVSEA